jgi:hypothetical protein
MRPAKKRTAILVGKLGSIPVQFWLDDEKLMLLRMTETGNMAYTSLPLYLNGYEITGINERGQIVGSTYVSQCCQAVGQGLLAEAAGCRRTAELGRWTVTSLVSEQCPPQLLQGAFT